MRKLRYRSQMRTVDLKGFSGTARYASNSRGRMPYSRFMNETSRTRNMSKVSGTNVSF